MIVINNPWVPIFLIMVPAIVITIIRKWPEITAPNPMKQQAQIARAHYEAFKAAQKEKA